MLYKPVNFITGFQTPQSDCTVVAGREDHGTIRVNSHAVNYVTMTYKHQLQMPCVVPHLNYKLREREDGYILSKDSCHLSVTAIHTQHFKISVYQK